MRHKVSRSRAFSKADLSRRPPLARTRTLPNSRVHKVAMRLVSLQSVVRSTSACAFSVAMAGGDELMGLATLRRSVSAPTVLRSVAKPGSRRVLAAHFVQKLLAVG